MTREQEIKLYACMVVESGKKTANRTGKPAMSLKERV
jgi:hypothetical protein